MRWTTIELATLGMIFAGTAGAGAPARIVPESTGSAHALVAQPATANYWPWAAVGGIFTILAALSFATRRPPFNEEI